MRVRRRLKVCCIRSHNEAQLAICHGADALGLVSAMPSGPGVIDDALIGEIAARVPPTIATFLLTSLTDGDAIVEQQRRCRTNTIQLVDEVSLATYATLRRALPGIAIVQVIHVVDEGALDQARTVAPHVDALLLDSGNPMLAIKELGGTGRVHDWSIAARIVDAVDRPVFLAGGLKPNNVADAVRRVRPFGVDLCSGLRIDGRLDSSLLAAFVAALDGAGVPA